MMISQFVYPTLFSCAILGVILIASLIPMFNNIWYTLNNLSYSTIIYIHCVLSTSTTVAICYIMVKKHNEELDALIKEQISIEIIDTSDLQSQSSNKSLKKEELEEDIREELEEDVREELEEDVREELEEDVREELEEDVREELKEDVCEELKEDVREELKEDVREELKEDVREELEEDVREELEEDVREALDRIADLGLMNDLQCGLNKFIGHILY